MKPIIAPSDTRSIHIFTERISFPVCAFAVSEWDETQISYLNHNVKTGNFTAFNICRWCQQHDISYQILFPEQIWRYMFKEPKRFLCYLYLKFNL